MEETYRKDDKGEKWESNGGLELFIEINQNVKGNQLGEVEYAIFLICKEKTITSSLKTLNGFEWWIC